jgi:glycosyltransferase involved in cell wall biosynthesis
MRIALVVTGGFDESGRERIIPSLVWLVERLARRHHVVVYVLRHHRTACAYPLAGATIVDLGRPAGLFRQWTALLGAMRRDGPFDIVHGYWAHPAGLLAAFAGHWHRMPSVVTCDSGEFERIDAIGYGLQRSFRPRAAVAAATRLASRVTVCSHFQAERAARHGVTAIEIPLGVDSTVFRIGAAVPRVPGRLLSVASINPVKDHDTLLAAVRRLADAQVPITLDVVGEDTLDGRIQRRVQELELEHRVVFHGFLPSDRLVALYQAASLFVLSSRHEAAGVVLLEAASCGLPVVGSNVGYLADWSPDRAMAVPPGDDRALADAIAMLVADGNRRQRLAAGAHAWTVAHDADWSAAAFEALYQELVSTRRAHSGRRSPR